MSAELVILGSGAFAPASDPRRVRNPAGYAVRSAGGLVLLDFGFGNLRQLARAGLDARDVAAAFFSHRHPDHVGDLAALLFHFNYEAKPRSGALKVFGPPGFSAFLRRLQAAHAPWLRPKGYRLSVKELRHGQAASLPGLTVRAHRVPHSTPSLAYRLEAGSSSLVYSGDTGWSETLAAFAKGADLFLLECTMPDRERFPAHLTARQAVDLIERSGCGLGVLTHLSEGSARDARRHLRKRRGILEARDGLRIRF